MCHHPLTCKPEVKTESSSGVAILDEIVHVRGKCALSAVSAQGGMFPTHCILSLHFIVLRSLESKFLCSHYEEETESLMVN